MQQRQIKSISFPNTVLDSEASYYQSSSGYSFEYVEKNGEMAPVRWIAVSKGGQLVAEVKESVCNTYFETNPELLEKAAPNTTEV